MFSRRHRLSVIESIGAQRPSSNYSWIPEVSNAIMWEMCLVCMGAAGREQPAATNPEAGGMEGLRPLYASSLENS